MFLIRFPISLKDSGETKWQKPLPMVAITNVIQVPLVSVTQLTKEESVKKTLEMTLDVTVRFLSFVY